MTRKDYVLLASAFFSCRPGFDSYSAERSEQWEADVRRIAQALASDNPRFDREKFLLACGYDSQLFRRIAFPSIDNTPVTYDTLYGVVKDDVDF